MNVPSKPTLSPARLAALCSLWQSQDKIVHLTIKGSSMLPDVPPGSSIRLSCGHVEPRIGDIVAARVGPRLVVHRLIKISREDPHRPLYICRGDANAFVDEPVFREQIVGIVLEVRRPSLLKRWWATVSRIGHIYARNRPQTRRSRLSELSCKDS